MRATWRWLLAAWLALAVSAMAAAAPGVAENSGASAAPGADEEILTFRSEVREVWLAFAASDLQGRSVHSLAAADVAVVDNEHIVRHFRSFSPAAESPLNLILLIDISGSMEKGVAKEAAAVEDFLKTTHWGSADRVSILAFSGLKPELICAGDCASGQVAAKLSAVKAEGQTPLYDAMFQAEEMIRKQAGPEYRSALILFSDGADNISMRSFGEVVERAQNLQAAVYSLNACPRQCASERGRGVLASLAASTGGSYYETGGEPRSYLRGVVEDLRSGYVLTYELPENEAGSHTVKVLAVRNPNLMFRSRSRYHEMPSLP